MLKCPHNRIQSLCKECLANKDNTIEEYKIINVFIVIKKMITYY